MTTLWKESKLKILILILNPFAVVGFWNSSVSQLYEQAVFLPWIDRVDHMHSVHSVSFWYVCGYFQESENNTAQHLVTAIMDTVCWLITHKLHVSIYREYRMAVGNIFLEKLELLLKELSSDKINEWLSDCSLEISPEISWRCQIESWGKRSHL